MLHYFWIRAMLLTKIDFDQIQRDDFALDCPLMELVPVIDGSRERYRGSGFVSYRDGQLRFKLFANQAYDYGNRLRESPAKAGELFEDSDHYVLHATDVSGSHWRSSQVLPDISYGSGVVAAGSIAELHAREDCELPITKPVLKLWFLGDLELPMNQTAHSATTVGDQTISESWTGDSAVYKSSGYELFARTSAGWTMIEVSIEGAELPEALDRRVEESVEFMLAHPVRATVVEELREMGLRSTIRSHKAQPITANALSPIRRRSTTYREHGWRLFDSFFRSIISHEGTSRPPLSRILQYIVQMNPSPIDAQALALGVAVEGLLNEVYHEVAPPPEDFLRELKDVEALIKEATISPNTVSRLLGSLGAMKGSRAKDRLLALVERNVVTQTQYQSWDKLRNSSAHAKVHGLDNRFLGLYYSVRVLAYCLMFNAISYEGPFTDYGDPGWPERYYPFGSGENLEEQLSS